MLQQERLTCRYIEYYLPVQRLVSIGYMHSYCSVSPLCLALYRANLCRGGMVNYYNSQQLILMSAIAEKRALLAAIPTSKPNKISKLDAITKFLKKLKTSGPDQSIAAQAVDYNLEKFTQEIMNVVKVWVEAEQNEPVATATLCYCLFEYEEFPNKFIDLISGMLSVGNRLEQAATKLKLMSLVTELYYAGRKVPVGQMFCQISVNIENYFVGYYLMQGLVYYFNMYPLKHSEPRFSLKPEDIVMIKKKLLTYKDIAVGMFEKEKQILVKNHKVYADKMKKGYVLTQQINAEQAKQAELIELKRCIETYCALFEFPCSIEYKKLEPEKEEQIIRDDNSGTVPALNLYDLRDFEVILPGIIFEEELRPDFQKEEKIDRQQIDFIKELSEKTDYRQVDGLFEELMTKYTCNQRAAMLAYIVETPQCLGIFPDDRLVFVARFVASFCQYWPAFVQEINYRIKQKIDSEWTNEFSEYMKKLLLLYAEFSNFGITETNKFMSVFKALLEMPVNPTVKAFVESSYEGLLEDKETKERTEYLLSKSESFKNLI